MLKELKRGLKTGTSTKIIDINDESGRLIASEWLAKAESAHRQLRPDLPQDYGAKMLRVFSQGGRMSVASQVVSAIGFNVGW